MLVLHCPCSLLGIGWSALGDFFLGQTNCFGDAASIILRDQEEVREHSHLDAFVALSKSTSDVLDAVFSLGVIEDVCEETTWLLVVGVRVHVRVSSNNAGQGLSVNGVLLVLNWTTLRVWFVVDEASLTVIGHHGSITLVVWAADGLSSVWTVNGDVVVVGSKTISLRIWVVDESSLEHLVVGGLDSWHEVSWGESNLLSFSMEVVGISVKGQLSDFLEWVVAMWPYLGNVVNIESVLGSIGKWHDLDEPGPRWEVAILDVVEQVHGGEILALHAHLTCFLAGEVLDSLISLEVVLDKVSLTLIIDPLESVGTVSVHVSESVWSSTVGHEDSDLVESLRGV